MDRKNISSHLKFFGDLKESSLKIKSFGFCALNGGVYLISFQASSFSTGI